MIVDLAEYRRRKEVERDLESDAGVKEWWTYISEKLIWAGVLKRRGTKAGTVHKRELT